MTICFWRCKRLQLLWKGCENVSYDGHSRYLRRGFVPSFLYWGVSKDIFAMFWFRTTRIYSKTLQKRPRMKKLDTKSVIGNNLATFPLTEHGLLDDTGPENFNVMIKFSWLSPVERLASIVFCLWPRTLNCGSETSEEICTEFRPSFHL